MLESKIDIRSNNTGNEAINLSTINNDLESLLHDLTLLQQQVEELEKTCVDQIQDLSCNSADQAAAIRALAQISEL